METLTLPREEWAVVAHQLGLANGADSPPGLRNRILALLDDVPHEWADQGCSLSLDPQSAAVVRAILRRARGQPRDPGLTRAQADAVAEADRIVRGHRPPPDPD